MKIDLIKTGSKGNSTLVTTTELSLLIDAGITLKLYKETIGWIPNPDLILITHGHSDHIKGLETLIKKTPNSIVVVNPETYQRYDIFHQLSNVLLLEPTEHLLFKNTLIKPFSTRHDTPGCMGFSIIDLNNELKYTHVTDTGVLTKVIKENIKAADVLFLESDYDEYYLEKSEKYDDELKARINSAYGHLSNQQVIEFLTTFDVSNIRHIILGHLSEETNSPDILTERLKEKVPEKIINKILISSQHICINLD